MIASSVNGPFIVILFIASVSTLLQACSKPEEAVSESPSTATSIESSPYGSENSAPPVFSQRIEDSQRPPNFLVIIADDLGYSDLGVFGSEIATPNVDALADQGLVATHFYTSPTCAPTRAMLLSGTDNHLAGIGTMPGHLKPGQIGKPGYETHLNDTAISLAEIFGDAGYHTSIVGKWHLGSEPKHLPNSRGFMRSFVLNDGGASHFDDMLGATNKVPVAKYSEDGESVASLPEDFYSTSFYTDKVIEYLEESRTQSKPFFAIASYTAPHWPLQAPRSHRDRYAGAYDMGFQEVAKRRLSNMKRLGLVKKHHRLLLPNAKDWENLDQQQKRIESRKMEIYSAMVSHLDEHIGRLVAYLKDHEAFANTVIVFMSDNGPDGGDPYKLHDNKNWIPETYDLSIENIGKRGSFSSLGPNWGSVSALPHRGFKGSTYEGGIRAPFVVSHLVFPSKIDTTDTFIHVSDVAPTLIDLASLNDIPKSAKYSERHAITGTSIVPIINGSSADIREDDFVMGWEILGRYAVRMGDWKAVRNNDRWEVFNLTRDPFEEDDISNQNPEKLEQLDDSWNSYENQNGVILPDRIIDY